MIELAPGIVVSQVVKASSPDQVAELLAQASRDQTSVIPFGGRRSLATGNPAEPAHTGLDLGEMAGIISYEPADLTLSLRAGTRVSDIQDELGRHGQELPIDVPYPERTSIGGLVAAGFAGPRRLRSGTLRDLLIGCQFARGDGLLAKAGGMVVKNVSGFEIPRFLHGSWGSLAVITSVNLKVTPRARADGTLLAVFDSAEGATDAALNLIRHEPSLDACTVTVDAGTVHVAARAVGRATAVAEMLDSFAASLGSTGDRHEAEASTAYWQAQVDRMSEGDHVVIALQARPRAMTQLVGRVVSLLDGVAGATMVVSPGTGSIRLAVPTSTGYATLSGAGALAAEGVARYMVESAPIALQEVVPAWGPEPDGMHVMQAVKRQFDPAGILNPQRLFV